MKLLQTAKCKNCGLKIKKGMNGWWHVSTEVTSCSDNLSASKYAEPK